MRSRAVVLVLAASGVLASAGAALTLPPAPEPPAESAIVAAVSVPVPKVDTWDRAEVTHLWRAILAPAAAVPMGWTGSVDGCRAGEPSAAAQQATRTAVNAARRLAGVAPVRFDPALSAKAQQAALVFRAQQDLSHAIPADWACTTSGARQAAAASDIALSSGSGGAGANAVLAYLAEAGGGNSKSVGSALHRRLLLDPAITTMGSGSTDTSNALWVRGARTAHPAEPAWIPWPTSGWFPAQLTPGRWSLSAAGADFRHAHVVVRTATGKALPVVQDAVVSGAGLPTLVWQVGELLAPADGHPRTVTVDVTGIRRGRGTVAHRWTVRLFDPTALVPAGGTRITSAGGTLSVHPAGFAPAAAKTTLQWTRDGVAIPGATGIRHRLTTADRGHRLAAVVTGSRAGWATATESASVRVPAR